MAPMSTGGSGATTAVIGGQTVRLASPGGTLLKPGTALTGPGGKQIILQKQGPGGSQPQIVTLVKTSQGMQVTPHCLLEGLPQRPTGVMSRSPPCRRAAPVSRHQGQPPRREFYRRLLGNRSHKGRPSSNWSTPRDSQVSKGSGTTVITAEMLPTCTNRR